jgi:ketosteroid isomerase-like protein
MFKLLPYNSVLIAFVCAAYGAGKPADSGDPAAVRLVRHAFDDYVRGWRSGDVPLLATIYAEDAQLSAYWPDPSRASRIRGWSQIKTDLEDIFGRIKGMDLEFNEREVNVYGDVAVLTSHWVWNTPADPMFATGRASFVFHRRGARWVIVHEHSSPTPVLPEGK